MKRRTFLQLFGEGTACVALLPLLAKPATASILKSPVTTNLLRPPGAVPEEVFPAKCIRCGGCVEVCPYRSIKMLDIRSGPHAGTPLIEVENIPCYLCMKCVDVCLFQLIFCYAPSSTVLYVEINLKVQMCIEC